MQSGYAFGKYNGKELHMGSANEREYYLRKSCCGGKVYGRFTFEQLKEQMGYGKDDTIKNMNDLEKRIVTDYKGFDFPYYIEPIIR